MSLFGLLGPRLNPTSVEDSVLELLHHHRDAAIALLAHFNLRHGRLWLSAGRIVLS